ncbi:PilZ domain-containing protein [Methylomonas koyamae]|uniref:PilZ domain-containing protein n=1 Tax=Methylomonas koyamae TaxID=702114 RepID=UPI0006D084AC|nr:PilZ domain-containing protein [Methylomonas koyamae]
MPTNINKPKQRRYIRYPIELAAVLVVDNRLKFDGVILDFCLGGFFLALKSPEQIPLDKAIKVQFSIAAATGGEQYEIDARPCILPAAALASRSTTCRGTHSTR